MSVFYNLTLFLTIPVLSRYTIYFQNNEHLINLYKSLSDQFIHYLGTVIYSYSLHLIRHIKKIYSLVIPANISWMPLYSLLPLFCMLQARNPTSHFTMYLLSNVMLNVKTTAYSWAKSSLLLFIINNIHANYVLHLIHSLLFSYFISLCRVKSAIHITLFTYPHHIFRKCLILLEITSQLKIDVHEGTYIHRQIW